MMAETADPFFAPYGEKFWLDYQRPEQREAAHSIGRVLSALTGNPKTILDVGCGAGQILTGFKQAGAERVFGLESPSGIQWCRKLGIFELDPTEYLAVDLRDKLPNYNHGFRLWTIDQVYHMVVCTEVAEHLPEAAANEMIRWICEDVRPEWFAFSGAIPGRGGTAHINEKPTPVWMRLIRNHGTHVVDWNRSAQFHNAMLREEFTTTWVNQVFIWRRKE
jgi:2-polyprenyl-3-methyl-5-hydroxy-6-metoxy-1,4-benzoquinol methylase